MPLTATLVTDRAIGVETLRRTTAGYQGKRNFFVNTADASQALLLAPIPQIGDPWSIRLPLCAVVDQQTEWWRGADGADGSGGTTIVRLVYETPNFRGGLPPPRPGLAFTRLRPSVETVTAFYDVDFTSFPQPLNNGNGVGKKVGRLAVDVYNYYQPGTYEAPLARLTDAMERQLVSDADLTLPPVEDGGSRLPMLAGEVQFESFDLGIKDGFIEVVFHLNLSRDFTYVWEQEDSAGRAIASVFSQVYETGDLSGLWL